MKFISSLARRHIISTSYVNACSTHNLFATHTRLCKNKVSEILQPQDKVYKCVVMTINCQSKSKAFIWQNAQTMNNLQILSSKAHISIASSWMVYWKGNGNAHIIMELRDLPQFARYSVPINKLLPPFYLRSATTTIGKGEPRCSNISSGILSRTDKSILLPPPPPENGNTIKMYR